jgi:SPP1 gp7 family putative phage head morphogenesis protein
MLRALVPNPAEAARKLVADPGNARDIIARAIADPDSTVLNQLYDGAYQAGATAAADVLGEVVPVPATFELDELYATGEQVWQRIADWTGDEIATAVTDGLKDTDITVSKLAETIGDILDDTERARTVAQTEVTRAMTTAALDTYGRFGSKQIEFLSANDGKVCPACDANEEQGAIPIDGTFKNGMPPVHPRCRCTVLPAN